MYSTMTIHGLYNYDKTIFDDMAIPDGVDKSQVISEIMVEGAPFEVLYSNPDTMKTMIKYWSNSRLYAWVRMKDALNAEYSPIENYDRTEEHTEEYQRELAENSNSSINDTTTIENSENSTNTNKIAAYNEEEPKTAELNTDENSYNGTNKTERTQNDSINYTGGDNRRSSMRAHGNIGVTTNQEMIVAEMQMRYKYDIVKVIVNEFIDKFCLTVY